MMKNKFIDITGNIVIIIVAIVCLITNLVTNIYTYGLNLNSDIAAEAILGRVICDSGQLIPGSWYRSTETRILSPANLSALFYRFTNNMNLSISIACFCFTLFIFVSIFLCAYLSKLDIKSALMIASLSICIPSTAEASNILYTYAGYYAGCVLILFITLILYEKLNNSLDDKKSVSTIFIIGVLLSVILGLQGMRGILVIYIPLCAFETIRVVITKFYYQKDIKAVNLLPWVWSVLLFGAGYLATLSPLSTQSSTTRNIRHGFSKLIEEVIPSMVSIINIDTYVLPRKIFLVFMLLCMLAEVVIVAIKIIKKAELSSIEKNFVIILISPLIMGIIVAFTTFDNTDRYYFMLMYAMVLGTVLLLKQCYIVVDLVAVLFVATQLMTVYVPNIKTANEFIEADEKRMIAEFLINNDYEYAAANFENADTIMGYSNGKVIVRSVADFDTMEQCMWLTNKDWVTSTENNFVQKRTAYIVSSSELEKILKYIEAKNISYNQLAQYGEYTILETDYDLVWKN